MLELTRTPCQFGSGLIRRFLPNFIRLVSSDLLEAFHQSTLEFHCLFVIFSFGAQGLSFVSGVWIVPKALNQIDSEPFVPVDLEF